MWFALFFACFFTASAVSQYFFVRSQLYSSIVKSLDRWADQIARAIYSRDRWTFQSYFNAYYEAPLTCYVVTQDGLLIYVEGFAPGLIWESRYRGLVTTIDLSARADERKRPPFTIPPPETPP